MKKIIFLIFIVLSVFVLNLSTAEEVEGKKPVPTPTPQVTPTTRPAPPAQPW